MTPKWLVFDAGSDFVRVFQTKEEAVTYATEDLAEPPPRGYYQAERLYVAQVVAVIEPPGIGDQEKDP